MKEEIDVVEHTIHHSTWTLNGVVADRWSNERYHIRGVKRSTFGDLDGMLRAMRKFAKDKRKENERRILDN